MNENSRPDPSPCATSPHFLHLGVIDQTKHPNPDKQTQTMKQYSRKKAGLINFNIISNSIDKREKRKENKTDDYLIDESFLEAVEAEVDFTKGLAGGEELLLGKVLDGDVVVEAEPAEGLDILAAALEYVAHHVGPPRRLLVVPLPLRITVPPLRSPELLLLPPPHHHAPPRLGFQFWSRVGDKQRGVEFPPKFGHRIYLGASEAEKGALSLYINNIVGPGSRR